MKTEVDSLPVWKDRAGNQWTCGASDHGPFCRLCQPLDGTLTQLLLLVRDGQAGWEIGQDGKFWFRLTDTGMEAARAIYERFGLDPDDHTKANLKAVLANVDAQEQDSTHG